jgi:hypothetical protein
MKCGIYEVYILGWNRYSIGYFSNNGCKYFASPFNGKPYNIPFNHGDVIGVGYRHRTGTIFFTRNGRRLEDAYTGLRWNLFPTIGANGPCQIHVNLGQAGFVFVEANVKKWGLAPSQGTLAPPPPYGNDRNTILLATGNISSSSSNYRPFEDDESSYSLHEQQTENNNENEDNQNPSVLITMDESAPVEPPPYSSQSSQNNVDNLLD